MGRRRLLVLLALGALTLATTTVVSTATNSVPATRAGESGQTIVANDLRPPECAALNLVNVGTSGTNAADLIVGTSAGETIAAGNGNDCVLAGAGDDRVRGGGDDDVLLGQAGDDDLSGGPGTDTCYGGLGTDVFRFCETEIP